MKRGILDDRSLTLVRKEFDRLKGSNGYSEYEIGEYIGSNAGSICHGEKIESKRLEHLMVVMVYDVALVFANCEVQQDLVIRAVNHSRGCNY